MKKRVSTLAVPAVFASLLLGCTINTRYDFRLDVPYQQQETDLWCGEASIVMWSHYDDRTHVTQSDVANFIASCPLWGYDKYRDAIRRFTYSGFDAVVDTSESSGVAKDEYISRQITTIDSRVPAWVVIGFNHAGIINGGKWREIPDDLYQWEYTYVHDPEYGPNVYYDSDFWLDENCWNDVCNQIVSSSASGQWSYNLNTWGGSVVDSAGDRRTWDGPIEY